MREEMMTVNSAFAEMKIKTSIGKIEEKGDSICKIIGLRMQCFITFTPHRW
jgi:hypothetical protein